MVTIFDPTGLLALILLVYVVDWSCGPCVFLVTRTVRTPYCGLLGQASSITLILTWRKKKAFHKKSAVKKPQTNRYSTLFAHVPFAYTFIPDLQIKLFYFFFIIKCMK